MPIAVFLATYVLYDPRAGDDTGALYSIALLLALSVLILPGSRTLWLSRWSARIAFVLGHTVGLAVCFSWIPGTLDNFAGYGFMSSWFVFIGACVSVSVGRLVVLECVRAASTPHQCIMLALVELASISWYCVFEGIGMLFAGADALGMPLCLRFYGYVPTMWILLYAAASVRDRDLRNLACILGIVVPANVAGTVIPHAGSPVSVAGIQGVWPEARADWQDVLLATYADLERLAVAQIVVWPEGAYPYIERVSPSWRPRFVGTPSRFTRVFGMHTRERDGRTSNVVVVQSEGGVRVRRKSSLVPIFESDVAAEVGEDAELLISGVRVSLPICVEIMDRALVRRSPGLGLIINISSDRFDPTTSASMIMSRAAWLRALEFGVTVIRVSDRSHSFAYDANGRRVGSLEVGRGVIRTD